MERKNSLLLWRARDIAVFILGIVGLALLLVYGSKAISSAGDRRYVEGWHNQPVVEESNTSLEKLSTPAVLAHIIPMQAVDDQYSPQTARPGKVETASTSTSTPGLKNGLVKHELLEASSKLIK